ncbi:hypothetical protein J2Y02_001919 [Neobacillus drentensis]|nr:hypothetical protein [Neobacillus drentensis]
MMKRLDIKPSNHYFFIEFFLIIKKHFHERHFKCKHVHSWIVYYNKEYFGLLTNYSDFTIKVFHKGACIQYFTSLKELDDWVKNGCTKQTLFMANKKDNRNSSTA